MDPLTAVSLAATIVQFVDFTSKIVSKGYRLYKSSALTDEYKKLEDVTLTLHNLTTRLKCSNTNDLDSLSSDEKEIAELAVRCTELGEELLERLNALKVSRDARYRQWKSFRNALKLVWTKEKLDDMAATLSEYRDLLQFRVLLSIRLGV